jgi:hypothetical protein
MQAGISSGLRPSRGGRRNICRVTLATCLRAPEFTEVSEKFTISVPSPLNIANMGYRISSTLASQFLAMGLNATWVLATVDEFGAARYFTIVSRGVGAGGGGMGVLDRMDDASLSLAPRGFLGEPKRPLNPEVDFVLGATDGASDVGVGFICSWTALRICGSRRMSSERENSKLGCSTLQVSTV